MSTPPKELISVRAFSAIAKAVSDALKNGGLPLPDLITLICDFLSFKRTYVRCPVCTSSVER